MRTYDQKMAEQAFQCVQNRVNNKEYVIFAQSFPSLVHSCGLAQAVSFAEAKKRSDYLDDMNKVLEAIVTKGVTADLSRESREAKVVDYVRLTRCAMSAASWLKRYVQAFAKEGE